MRLMRRVGLVVGGVVAVAVLTTLAVEAGVPIGGISRSEAVAAATTRVKVESSTPPQLAWAVPGLFGFFRDGATDAVGPWSRPVWAIRLTGTFRGSCGPASVLDEPLRCPGPDHTETVILDYRTGEFIMASIEP